MNDEEIKKMIDNTDVYDDSKEDTLRAMIGEFYSRRMLSSVILVWGYGIVFTALAVYSAVKFFDVGSFDVDGTKDLIMYATIFLSSVVFISLLKSFAWQMIHKNRITRAIKRLELRVAELTETLQNK